MGTDTTSGMWSRESLSAGEGRPVDRSEVKPSCPLNLPRIVDWATRVGVPRLSSGTRDPADGGGGGGPEESGSRTREQRHVVVVVPGGPVRVDVLGLVGLGLVCGRTGSLRSSSPGRPRRDSF